ncbi:MAG: glycosyltransferase family 2 protein [Candidatus Daviesbacteria bacterium]|nr:glycosyltransferase family 2 protein [Candidatus Daviesbacteria bacterium]
MEKGKESMKKEEKLVSVVIVTRNRKKDLIECLDSYIKSSYKNTELIILDNASQTAVSSWLPKKYEKIEVITTIENVGAAEGRNIGFSKSSGYYIVFSDDDAVADTLMIEKLVSVFESHKNVGIVQPLIYEKNKKKLLQGAGHNIDLTTGRINAWGVREQDTGQYNGLREIPMVGCVWMVTRDVFNKVGGFDKDYFIPYEDSDFSFKVSKAGFKIYCYSDAKTWHRGHKNTFIHPWIEWLGITSKERAYRIARNKMIFIRKHSSISQKIIFFFFLLPLYTIIHSLIMMASARFDILYKYWLGVLSGIWYSLTYSFKRNT